MGIRVVRYPIESKIIPVVVGISKEVVVILRLIVIPNVDSIESRLCDRVSSVVVLPGRIIALVMHHAI